MNERSLPQVIFSNILPAIDVKRVGVVKVTLLYLFFPDVYYVRHFF